jgi:hypothetical protein
MMWSNASFQGLLQLGNLGAQQPSRDISASRWLSCSPFTIASNMARPEAPKVSVATEANLMLASSNTL